MARNSNKSLDFLIGAVLGGVLGSTASLLMAPKSGRELRDDIRDTYEDIADKASDLTQQAAFTANGMNHDLNYLLLGGLSGATIGAITALLSAPKSGREFREDMLRSTNRWARRLNRAGKSVAHNAGEQAGQFKELIKDVAERLVETSDRKYGTNFHSKIEDIMDFANLGLRLIRGRSK